MHLKLTRNTRTVKPGLELETRHENGDITRTPVKSDSLFHGKEISDPDSLVAVSNDKGLVSCLVIVSAMLSFVSIQECNFCIFEQLFVFYATVWALEQLLDKFREPFEPKMNIRIFRGYHDQNNLS